MITHRDPTASRTIGSVEKEWKRMIILAYRYRTETYFATHICDPQQLFCGIYSRLLTDSLKELEDAIASMNQPARKPPHHPSSIRY